MWVTLVPVIGTFVRDAFNIEPADKHKTNKETESIYFWECPFIIIYCIMSHQGTKMENSFILQVIIFCIQYKGKSIIFINFTLKNVILVRDFTNIIAIYGI